MQSVRRLLPDALIIGLLFFLPLLMFWPQTVGGQTLIPAENLYQYDPWFTYRGDAGAPTVPHNALVSDLVLQNYQWKSFIRQSIDAGEIPLWNPHQFGGLPFMAAGQQSTLYPVSVLYYVLPLPAAYGWFTVLNLWLAGVFMLGLLRGLGVRSFGGAVAGITYQLCGFFIASAVHPMIIAAGAWLPLILLMAEWIIQARPLLGRPTSIPWTVVGAGAIACNLFAGHVEITIYTLLITGFYSALRLAWAWRERAIHGIAMREMVIKGAWLAGMVALGIGLASVQFIPLYEFAGTNHRALRTSYDTVVGYAHPMRDFIQYVLPNFYGSPAQHSYLDIFSLERVGAFTNFYGEPINVIDWGIKNYVEGALYVGILPLVLAVYALLHAFFIGRKDSEQRGSPPYRVLFALITVISLTFMFGLPTYRLIYALPNINQLNTPFRWVYGVTFGLAVLAGFGADALWRSYAMGSRHTASLRWARRIGLVLMAGGVLTLLGLLLSRVFYDQLAPTLQRVIENTVNADRAFSDGRMFYSYEFPQVLVFGVMLLLAGAVFVVASFIRTGRAVSLHASGVLALIAVDLLIASWGFNPASDPDLLDYTPPAITWLQEQQATEGAFRYTTLEAPGQHVPLLQANATMVYGLDDLRGYESIIPLDVVEYMRALTPQNQLDFNRIAPIYTEYHSSLNFTPQQALNAPRLDLMNVRYLVTHISTALPAGVTGFEPVYEDAALRIYENAEDVPRVFTVPGEIAPSIAGWEGAVTPVAWTPVTSREKFADVAVSVPTWLVVSENYHDGWRAFVRPQGAGDDLERPLDVQRVLDNLQGVRLDPAELRDLYADAAGDYADAIGAGAYSLRLVYSPQSFQVGAFGSVISAALLVFLLGVWLWRVLIGGSDDDSASVSRVARNSIAPIILNLFNRGIDFAFAFVMLRILGPTDAGIYYYAIVVFVWFDIFTNFGLDVFLIREASRERERAGYFLLNTSVLRFMLVFACVPLLLGFIFIRQATVEPSLSSEALVAIGLLYIGLAPGSISKGLTSLFYAFEKAEYPAAVTTITTINKAVLGLIVLLLGYGIVGLAGVSIVVNLGTLAILWWSARGMIRLSAPASEAVSDVPARRDMMRRMVNESWPLMLNHFLATVFFQIDIVILEALRGARIVGQYSVAYRWLLALNIIPAFFTQALLPVMSRQASEDRDALRRTYTLGVKLLVAVAIPVAVGLTFMAEALVLFLGGTEFMPAGAIALQIMIWSIPIGWMNSLTQYALIAVDLQRRITRAFAVAVSFNIITNLIFIPQFGYQAAAVTTIFSEAVLLLPFGLLLQSALGRLDWLDMVWRPGVAGGVMLGVVAVLWPFVPILALVAGSVVYLGMLWLLKPLSSAERVMLAPLLPGRLKRLVLASA